MTYLLARSLKLDFGNNDALQNAAVNVDVPRCPGILDEEALFLQYRLDMVESILAASVIGISYSNSGRTIPIRRPLMAIVAIPRISEPAPCGPCI